LEKNFVEVKTMNPTTQFLIREATTTQPRIIANYDFAQERFISIAGLNEAQIERRLALLVDVGRTLPRILKDPLAFNRHKPTIDFNEHPFADAGFYNNE
jgi:hypothetical protein